MNELIKQSIIRLNNYVAITGNQTLYSVLDLRIDSITQAKSIYYDTSKTAIKLYLDFRLEERQLLSLKLEHIIL